LNDILHGFTDQKHDAVMICITADPDPGHAPRCAGGAAAIFRTAIGS
jgi:hypothetical protein